MRGGVGGGPRLATWYRRLTSRGGRGLLRLEDALAALGADGDMGQRTAEVAVADVVGTAGRPFDFDHEFRLVNKALQSRWDGLFRAVASGVEPPAVKLVQLGELYFVKDGHHRVSVARALGRLVVTAHVHRICTIAYAKACLRAAHLPTKAAERRFLERVPLPADRRRDLWLDEPAEWMRLADAADAWGLRWSRTQGRPPDRCELAGLWWTEEVVPMLDRLRAAGVGLDLRDVQLYVTALAARDRLGHDNWRADLIDHL
jgi:hypothetical protein